MRDIACSATPLVWRDGLQILDQRLLPGREQWILVSGVTEAIRLIRSLAVRGAPAIGLTAAYALAAEARRRPNLAGLRRAAHRLAQARPTAVNLAHAVDEVLRAIETSTEDELFDRVLATALALHDADRQACLAIGEGGAQLFSGDRLKLLTICNAGALATGGIGTALGIVRTIFSQGRLERVFACETRPVLQGARLTAWELGRDGIPVTLLPDGAAASLLASQALDGVVVGADRIAADGSVANKVGTYALALAAKRHNVPFVVAAPSTTFDLICPDGRSIPIEQRRADEVTRLARRRLAPPDVAVFNPAFDVTPPDLITAIVSEFGSAKPVNTLTVASIAKASRKPAGFPASAVKSSNPTLQPSNNEMLSSPTGFPNRSLRTLGIETSCDETAVAVLEGDGGVSFSLISSQIAAHAAYLGVVPELAARHHLQSLPAMLALADAKVGLAGIELIAVTRGPGLIGSLLVGTCFASAYAHARNLPLIGVDHLEGHLVSPFISLDGAPARLPEGPVLTLVVSGGHSSYFLDSGDQPRPKNRTRDDAAGEIFDKLAAALSLGYPGGPVIDRLADEGNPNAFSFSAPRIKDPTGALDFSFSGLKTAAIRQAAELTTLPLADSKRPPQAIIDLLASFRRTVVDWLLAPLDELVARYQPKIVAVSGGVSANQELRRRLLAWGKHNGMEVVLPPLALTTDNAAMIARAGQLRALRGEYNDPLSLKAYARAPWKASAGKGGKVVFPSLL